MPGASVGRRLVWGSIANFADKLALLFVQLLAIPLLSHHWGAEGYGTWLMLMTIPTYVALSDFGLWTVAGVEITQQVARDNYDGALQTFQSAWVIVSTVLLAVVLLASAYAIPVVAGALNGDAEFAAAVVVTTLYGAAVVQMATLAVVYRSTHKFALAALISTLVTMAEGLALLVAVIAGAGYLGVTGALLCVRVLGVLASYVLLRQREPWFGLGVKHVNRDALWRLASPSAAAFSIAVANGVSLQGTILVVGWVAGPAAAAVYGASRFLARIPLQFSGLVVRTSIPELTRATASNDNHLLRRLVRINVASALVPTLPWVPLLIFAGPLLLQVISAGELEADWWLFGLLAVTTALGALWQALASPLVAVNQQSRFSYYYVLLCCCAVAAVLASGPNALVVAPVAILVSELAVTVLTLRLAGAAAPRKPGSG